MPTYEAEIYIQLKAKDEEEVRKTLRDFLDRADPRGKYNPFTIEQLVKVE